VRRGRLKRGPGRAGERGGRQVGREKGKRKATVQLAKSNTCISRDPKITKFLLKQDHTTKNILQQQTLKKTSKIAHNNSSKTAVFKLSKNFMAQQRHPKIEEKYLKIII
jgi:hypothetical protein